MLVFFLFHVLFSGPTNNGDNSGKLKLLGTFPPESDPMTTTTTQALHRTSPKKLANGLHVPSSLLHAQHRIWDSQISGLEWHFFSFFSQFSVQGPETVATRGYSPSCPVQCHQASLSRFHPSERKWPYVQECISALQEGISSAGSYFPNYQRRGPLCSIADAMVSHAGHINTGEQASVTHSWVCSSPKAPARPMPMQTTLPIPHLNHTGFLQEPEAKIQCWKWRFLGSFHSHDGYRVLRRI